MKRVWRAGSLVLLALLIVQPAVADAVCAPQMRSSSACATCPISVGHPHKCPESPTLAVQGQNCCCHADVQDFRQQALVERYKPDQSIGHGAIERLEPRVAFPSHRGSEPGRILRTLLPAASMQSLYCTFLE